MSTPTIQNNQSPNLAAQSNTASQDMIQSTAAQIKSLQKPVTDAANQVQALTTTAQDDSTALAADPKNKDLQAKVAADFAALAAAKDNLDTLSKQLADLVAELPQLIAAAKAQDAATDAANKTQANSAKQDQEAQNQADAVEKATSNSKDISAAAKQALLLKQEIGDSYGPNTTEQTPALQGLSEQVSDDSSPGSLGASQSGSQLDAGETLKQNGIQANTALRNWLSDKLGAQFDAGLYDAAAALTKPKDGENSPGTSGTSSKGQKPAKAKGAPGTLGAGANSDIPASFTNNTSANGGITDKAGKLGFAVNTGATAPDGQASVNPSNLSPNEILMLVMLEATDELNKEMQGMAVQLQKATSQKTELRNKLNQINGGIRYETNLSNTDAQTNSKLKNQSNNVQNDLSSIGDDTQQMQLRLQNMMQMQQQFIQAVSNISKSLNDTSMSVLRHIGS